MADLLRTSLLAAASNQTLNRFVSTHGRRFGADRFVAGETVDEFMQAVRLLNGRGFRVAAGLLGEDVRTADDARSAAEQYAAILDRFAREGANANVALKLTHLGLALDPGLAFENLRAVAARAASVGNFVRIDMEQSAHTQATLDIYHRLRGNGMDNVGVVLQAYLYRSESDLSSLKALAPNVRLVKGAYLEPASVAFARKRDVDDRFASLIEVSLQGGGFTAIATHDDAIIERSISFIRDRGIAPGSYEFQMLFGVRPKLQELLLRRGFPVRIAVPFGSLWFPYFMRRLAERPANVLFFLRSMWRG
ncbi:MAG TPA: proline dehydrogenase family protein [Candidatus Eremiobacteraceae bacterium]|nr:proline dehydrogenase family protein [Candidatus Eremiobacteraceae bacterium]